ncbi:hypothetical protein Tco_0856074 [Tanacetum coccineum]
MHLLLRLVLTLKAKSDSVPDTLIQWSPSRVRYASDARSTSSDITHQVSYLISDRRDLRRAQQSPEQEIASTGAKVSYV